MNHNIDLIVADERRIKQVVLNLLSNAFKFTPDGGLSLCKHGEFRAKTFLCHCEAKPKQSQRMRFFAPLRMTG